MTQRQKRILSSVWVVVALALAIRLVAALFLYRDVYKPRRDYWPFGYETGRIARSIAEGHGFGNPLFHLTGLTAWMTPVYPYLLAGIFKLFGVYSKLSALAILSLNSLFSALTCIPIFYIARRCFGRSTAVWAAWAWALFPYAIYLSGSFVWENCLSALLVTTLVLLTFQLKERWRRSTLSAAMSWLGYGLLWGFAALVNASVLALLPFLAGWALVGSARAAAGSDSPVILSAGERAEESASSLDPGFSYEPLRRRSGLAGWLPQAALVLCGLVVMLLPWEIRNYRDFHRVIPLRDNFGLELWVGNNGNTLHWFTDDAHPSTSDVELSEYEQLGELRYMALKRRQALDFITHHPGAYAVTSFRRFVFTWTGYWSFDPRYLAEEPYDPANICMATPLTLLMLLGLWQAFRRARAAALPFAMVIAFYPVVFYLTHPGMRYRDVIDPEIVILAVFGALWLIARRRKDAQPAIEEAEPVEETAGVR